MTVQRAFRELNVANPLVHALNGEDGLARLTEEAKVRPCLILLDLNMPKMNGLEFLHLVKAHPELKTIPVVVLTTSSEEGDVATSFTLNVAGYIVKPVDYAKFLEAVRTVNLYWRLSEMPNESAEENHAERTASVIGGG